MLARVVERMSSSFQILFFDAHIFHVGLIFSWNGTGYLILISIALDWMWQSPAVAAAVPVLPADVVSLTEHKEALQLQELLFQDRLLQKEREIQARETSAAEVFAFFRYFDIDQVH